MANGSQGRTGRVGGLINMFNDTLAHIPESLVAIMARVSLAVVFWQSGQTKVDGFSVTDQAIFLFEYEYQVPIIPPEIAAHMAAFGEHFLPVLLILGLATRFAATGLLFMTLVIQTFVYPEAWVTHLLWSTGLVYLMARGAGMFSVDYFIALGRK